MMAQSGSGSGGGEIEVPNGVYIQDADGVLWQEAAWDGSATPNGVAVVTDECRFVIAMSESYYSIPIYEGSYSPSMSLTIYSYSSTAMADFSGSSNTTAMTSAYGNDKSWAAGYCADFTFPNGKKGYLGSMGEWEAAYDYKTAVITCMDKVSDSYIRNDYYWTSTRAGNINSSGVVYNRFWSLDWTQLNSSSYKVTSQFYARPFTELGEVTGIMEA